MGRARVQTDKRLSTAMTWCILSRCLSSAGATGVTLRQARYSPLHALANVQLDRALFTLSDVPCVVAGLLCLAARLMNLGFQVRELSSVVVWRVRVRAVCLQLPHVPAEVCTGAKEAGPHLTGITQVCRA